VYGLTTSPHVSQWVKNYDFTARNSFIMLTMGLLLVKTQNTHKFCYPIQHQTLMQD